MSNTENASHTLRGAFLASNVSPGYAKGAYPGLTYLHASGVASPKGCWDISPGWSVFCDTRGQIQAGHAHPGRGARSFPDTFRLCMNFPLP